MEVLVVIVGAGPSGLATSVCLSKHSIPHVILEQEDCYASLWKKRAYDRLKLHLAKTFCELPFMPHDSETPTFMSKDTFISYLDAYVRHFDINPNYCRRVESASFDGSKRKWILEAKNTQTGGMEVYVSKFLVVASGENSQGYIPDVPGLETFEGEILHSSNYKSGSKYKGKNALVVGCGNSGMEISYDLSNFGAHTRIVVRNPFHVLTKEMVHLGMALLKYFPVTFVDNLITTMANITYGDLSSYGLTCPEEGPFYTKTVTGKTPVIDVGTIEKIQTGKIQVVPAISKIEGNHVTFENGLEHDFDVIVFATGYKSLAAKWLKDYHYVLNEDGFPKSASPNHWKGEMNLYCAGLSRMGIAGVTTDAIAIADDIKNKLGARN